MSLDFTDDQSILLLVMAWCRQATSHYPSQCCPRSLSLYGVTGPQCDMAVTHICISDLDQHCFRKGLVAWSVASHHLTKADFLSTGPPITNSSENKINTQQFSIKKGIWKCRLRFGVHLVPISVCQCQADQVNQNTRQPCLRKRSGIDDLNIYHSKTWQWIDSKLRITVWFEKYSVDQWNPKMNLKMSIILIELDGNVINATTLTLS